MKTKFLKTLTLVFCAVLLLSSFVAPVSAHTLSKENIYEETTEPTPKNYEWANLEGAKAIHQTAKYFIIDTTAGGREESLYISFPAEGGFRLQSKHAYQEQLEVSNEGLFEPSSIAVIDYKTDTDGAIVMSGSDGTKVRYKALTDGFALEVLNSEQVRVIYVTNWQISFGYQKNGNIVRTVVEMPMDTEKEVIYNGGTRYTTPNIVGTHFSLTNKDCFSDDEYSYGNIPFFHSNRGYSIWFNMTYPGEANFGCEGEDKYSVFFNGDKLDFYLWSGTPLENIEKYTDITGTSGVPEEWTFGFWTGGANVAYEDEYKPAAEKKNAYQNLIDLVEGFKENYNFYPEACFVEGYYDAKMLGYGKDKGMRMLSWMRPYYSTEEMTALFPELINPMPKKNADGTFSQTGWPYLYNQFILEKTGEYVFTSPGWMDTSNPSFQTLLSRRFKDAWDWGLQGMMLDFGDQLSYYGTAFNGVTANEMHNFHNYYYAKYANAAWTERFGNDYVLFQRTTAPGTQYYTSNFQGDQVHDWEGYGDALYDMISRGAGGFNLYGADLGGLRMTDEDGNYAHIPNKDLWNRWIVLSTFSPYMRQHGIFLHQPWDEEKYGYASKQNFGEYYYLRKNLVPTLMDAAIDANKTSNPLIKGMMVAYPYYLSLSHVNNQYLFCDDFLVCAVEKALQHTLIVSFPTGNSWYSLFTNKKEAGGQSITVEAPSNFMPIYIKDGSVKAINLPDSMELMDEIHDAEDFALDSALPAESESHESLLITPPDAKRETVIYTKVGASEDFRTYVSTTETYVSAPKDDTTFTVSNAEGSRREIIVAIGVTAAEVSYDGQTLNALDHVPNYYGKEYGYYVDLSGRTTIYLPAGWKELSVVKGDSAYEKYAVSTNNTAKTEQMFDNDPVSAYVLPVAKKQVEIYLKDDAVQTIGRIEVKWTPGFMQSYDIEYTTDGVNWSLLLPEGETQNTVSAGGGGIDIIEFAPVDAMAIRLTGVKDGDVNKNSIGIYEMNILPPNTAGSILPGTEDSEDDYDDYEDDYFGPEDWEDEDEDDEYVIVKKKKLVYPGMPLWAIILIIGGGVIVATGGVLLFILLARKNKKQAAEQALEEAIAEAVDISDTLL